MSDFEEYGVDRNLVRRAASLCVLDLQTVDDDIHHIVEKHMAALVVNAFRARPHQIRRKRKDGKRIWPHVYPHAWVQINECTRFATPYWMCTKCGRRDMAEPQPSKEGCRLEA